MQVSLIKEALWKASMVAYALRSGKASVDIDKELKNHEVEFGVIDLAALWYTMDFTHF